METRPFFSEFPEFKVLLENTGMANDGASKGNGRVQRRTGRSCCEKTNGHGDLFEGMPDLGSY